MVVILKKYGLLLKPQNILLFSRSFLPWGSAATLVCFMIGTLWGLALTPADYQQGNLVKIMYVHVPASWGALAIYTLMAICSAAGLILRMPLYFYATQSLAPIGASFCFLSLVTGSLWGKPTWGMVGLGCPFNIHVNLVFFVSGIFKPCAHFGSEQGLDHA